MHCHVHALAGAGCLLELLSDKFPIAADEMHIALGAAEKLALELLELQINAAKSALILQENRKQPGARLRPHGKRAEIHGVQVVFGAPGERDADLAPSFVYGHNRRLREEKHGHFPETESAEQGGSFPGLRHLIEKTLRKFRQGWHTQESTTGFGMYSIIFLLIGLAVGFFGALVGLGGGFLFVPIFLLIFHVPHEIAVGTSLCVLFFTALSGTIVNIRQRVIDYAAGWPFALATIPGAFAGGYVLQSIPAREFRLIFGFVLGALGLWTLWRQWKGKRAPLASLSARWKGNVERRIETRDGRVYTYRTHHWGGMIFALFVGFAGNLLGMGGGIIQIPAMIGFFGFPPHVAAATSLFVVLFTSAFGAVMHVIGGSVLWKTALLGAAGAIVGAQAGARLSPRIHSNVLVQLIAGAMIFVGLRLLWS